MNRAMFSGVAGMKTHQTRLDVIGNNIANVNTYGYKTQRAVFSDVFYQTMTSASQGTASRGGTNPSSIGYGSTLAAIQTQMSQSSMQNTGFGLDVAITGEGFLQVMDPDGNIFYTKAGLLDYDANGYLVDINGNFVLGATDVNGNPNTQKIKLDNGGSISPASPKAVQTAEGITYTMTATNTTKDGNVPITITSGELPIGQKARAVISESGQITVMLNNAEKFATLTELNTELNKAITEANNNEPHVAGTFTLAMTNADGTDASGKFNSGTPARVTGGPNAGFMGGAVITGLSANFSGSGTLSFTGAFDATNGLTITATDGVTPTANTYTCTIPYAQINGSAPVACTLTGTAGGINMTVPSLASIITAVGSTDETDFLSDLGAGSANFNTVMNVESTDHSYAITPAGTSTGLTGAQIAQANFDVTPGNITGLNVGGFSFNTTSNNFAGSGNVSRFELTYTAGAPGTNSSTWDVAVDIGGVTYQGTIPEGTAGSSLMLKSTAGDSFTLNIPTFNSISELYLAESGDTAMPATAGAQATLNMADLDTNPFVPANATATVAIPSSNLGLTTLGFTLTGGTAGGTITLDQLTSISIGSDGTVTVSHPDKGTMAVGKVSLANFANPWGLAQEGTNYYSETINSGSPVLCDPGTNGSGALKANSLEMSNVDLAQEFADMITTQRGFQANTRVITVSDTMLEELINLKR